ncbi:MAG: branched-chain amino acid ABC transporter permease [Nitrospinae bacterium]|nr:branched-chain amino acid ABC transporter permease [Nitrospinota bacterium]
MTELVVYGIVLGSIMALGAIGLTLLYGILRFAHFAHGDFMTIGAYVVLFLNGAVLPGLGIPELRLTPLSFGGRMLGALLLSMGVTAVIALLIDRLLYAPLRDRKSSPVILAMASLGMAFILRSLIYIVWGPQFLFYSQELRPAWELPWEVRLRPDQAFILATVLLLVLLLSLFLQRTRLGKAMRATADNPQLAWVCGIDTARVTAWTWLLGAALAAAAGVLYGIDAQLRPDMGWSLLLPLFAAVILGGIGSPLGALAGAMILGVVQQLSTAFLLPTYKSAVAFLVLIILLLVRPRGLFGG